MVDRDKHTTLITEVLISEKEMFYNRGPGSDKGESDSFANSVKSEKASTGFG